MDMKRFFLYFITIAALTLAGCGGGGGGTSLMVGGDRATQDAINALADSLATAQGDRDAANETLTALMGALRADSTSTEDLTAAVTGLDGMRDMYQSSVTAATTAIDAALGADAEGDLAADIGTLHQRYMDESGTSTTYGDALEAVRMALDATSISETDLLSKVQGLETMRNTYRTMVSQVRDALDLDGMADVDDIVMAIRDLQSDGLLTQVQNYSEAAEMASTNAVDAVDDAKLYSTLLTTRDSDDSRDLDGDGKTDTIAVGGDSMKAAQFAQTVLHAYRDAMDAETKAKEALGALEGLQTEVEDDQSVVNRDAVLEAIEEAIKVAEEAVETAEERAGSKSLKRAREAVIGKDEDAKDYPFGPEYHAEKVAMDIGTALQPTATSGAGARVTPHQVSADQPMTAVEINDHRGETWAEIVGTTVEKRIINTIEDTNLVDAAKFDGMDVSTAGALNASGVREALVLDSEVGDMDDGAEHRGNYEGILGTVFCAAADCSVTENSDGDRLLSGSWYFAPATPKVWYVFNEETETYVLDTQYAKFGYWLGAANDDARLTQIHTFAKVGSALTDKETEVAFNTQTVNMLATDTILLDARATYSGDAIGMSVHKEVNSDNVIVPGSLQSGQFTADVALTAIFGPNAALEGTIDNFQSDNPDAVDNNWEVKLLRQGGFADGTFGTVNNDELQIETAGDAVGTSLQDGYWTAAAYGSSANARPEGIYGTFNAHFTDGHVAGAYATQKD